MKNLPGNLAIGLAALFILSACSSGDLRLFSDALNNSNGRNVTYPDQSDTEYVGDIKWVTGVRNGSGFQKITNTGRDYCKVKVTFENGNDRIYKLGPGESTGREHMSIYNQADYMNTLCNRTSRVYSEAFKK